MTDKWNTRTKLVHEGSRRSQYGEMAEAIYLTQGFVYPTAESAEERFIKAGDDEFIYARYGNPTTRMFEDRIAALEGTEDAFATARAYQVSRQAKGDEQPVDARWEAMLPVLAVYIVFQRQVQSGLTGGITK